MAMTRIDSPSRHVFARAARLTAAAVAVVGLLAPSWAAADGRGHRGGYHGGYHGGHLRFQGHPGHYGGFHAGYRGWRPHIGLHVYGLPSWRSVVVVGGISYLVANGVYYRERLDGGYVVVAPPDAAPEPRPAEAPVPRQFVYPRQNQSPERQAGDEYDCHRWAVSQSGFDPAAAATGHAPAADERRPDYQRARSACLDGRGYTVR
jgi:hypothetical protein